MSNMLRSVLAALRAGRRPQPGRASRRRPSRRPQQQTFPTADAAADAIVDALRKNDDKATAAMLGAGWRDFVQGSPDEEDKQRADFLAAWDAAHKVVADGDKATIEVGTTGFVMPIPLVKEAGGWRFDVDAGHTEITAREIGRNELTVVQSLLAIVDAQRDYSALDPMKTGVATYARRLLSSPGKKDGLYWETKPGEPESPLGALVAKAQPGDREIDGYYGYHYRLLYGQGPAAKGGAYSYLVNGRMIGGFGVIAWPVQLRRDRRDELHRQPGRRGLRAGSRARNGAARRGHHAVRPGQGLAEGGHDAAVTKGERHDCSQSTRRCDDGLPGRRLRPAVDHPREGRGRSARRPAPASGWWRAAASGRWSAPA